MISTESEFYKTVQEREFVDKPSVQECLFDYAIKNPKFNHLFTLWLIQEAYAVVFSFIILEPMILEVATIDEILKCLEVFQYKPSSFVEVVLNKGSSAQIERLNAIIRGVFNE